MEMCDIWLNDGNEEKYRLILLPIRNNETKYMNDHGHNSNTNTSNHCSCLNVSNDIRTCVKKDRNKYILFYIPYSSSVLLVSVSCLKLIIKIFPSYTNENNTRNPIHPKPLHRKCSSMIEFRGSEKIRIAEIMTHCYMRMMTRSVS